MNDLSGSGQPAAATAESQASPPGLLTLAVVANVAIGLVAMTICLPAMVDWPGLFGASRVAVQATYGAFLTTFALGQLITGPLSDHFGRRRVLLAGQGLFVLASLGLAAANSIEAIILGRAVQGAGVCACMVVGRALVQDAFRGADQTRVLAYTGIAMGVMAPLGAVLGGWLHVHLGWQTTFLAVALNGMVLAGLTAAAVRDRPRADRPKLRWGSAFAGYVRLWHAANFAAYVVIAAGCTATFYAFVGGAPTVLPALGVATENVGWYLFFCSGAYIAGNWLTSRLARRFSERALLGLGHGATITGAAVMTSVALASTSAHPVAFAAPVALMGFGHGLIQPPALKGATGASAGDAGAAAAVSGAVMQGSGALAGYALGLVPVLDQTSMAAMMLATTLLSALASVGLLWPRVRRGA